MGKITRDTPASMVGNQLSITKWLRKSIGTGKGAGTASIYFDDTDLVLGDRTVAHDALGSDIEMGELETIVRAAMAKAGINKLRP